MKTHQQIFEHVARHLFKQGKPALMPDEGDELIIGSCAYRGAGGTMCAVGCLIDDAHYRPDMEGFGIKAGVDGFARSVKDPDAGWHATAVAIHKALRASGIDMDAPDAISLLADLQEQVHDEPKNWTTRYGNEFNPRKLRQALKDVAAVHDLDAQFLDTLELGTPGDAA